jgi:hypothetical protein
VILFTNTSLSDQDVLQHHFAIFRELFKHAEALKEKGRWVMHSNGWCYLKDIGGSDEGTDS